MNRNLMLFAIFTIVAAALWGCGGTSNGPDALVVPDAAVQDDGNQPDDQAKPDSVQPEADPPDGNVTDAGQDAKSEADAAQEAEASVPPDGGKDADAQSEAEASTEAGQDTGPDIGPEQDAQAEDATDAQETDAVDPKDGSFEADTSSEIDASPEVGVDAQSEADAPPPSEVCDNSTDDDLDGLADCADPDCYSFAACKTAACKNPSNWGTPLCVHDWGTCPTQASNNQPLTCGTWPTEPLPYGPVMMMNGCANGPNDQHVVGGDYNNVRFLRNNGTWSEVSLPVSGEPNITPPDVTCVGAGDAFATYNVSSSEGAFVRWNGTSWVRLAASFTDNLVLGAIWGTDANHVWFLGRSATNQQDVHVYRWDGQTLTADPLPTFGVKAFWGSKMWGSSLTDVWIGGHVYQVGGTGTFEATILHWDGYSWARVPVNLGESKLHYIHGTSNCDVMASGYTGTGAQAKGVTIQRNGSVWDVQQYTQLSFIRSLVKLGSSKFLLQAREDLNPACRIWMGESQGNLDVAWKYLSNEVFVAPGPMWRVPGTNTVMVSDEGPTGLEIRRSTCQ